MAEIKRRRHGFKGPFPSLRAFFQQTGIKQHDIAQEAGISDAHLSNIISGFTQPSLRVARILSRLTNVPLEAIGADPNERIA